MLKLYEKFLYNFIYLIFIISIKNKKQDFNNRIANLFVEFNNRRVLKKIKNKNNDKILILLPHCIQKYECKYRVTSNIYNCISCGQCVVADFVKIDNKKITIKIATGGTLARKYIKEIKPSLVIAVACKRDLVSGIKDAYPYPVYGIFNIIKNEPCINTTISMENFDKVLKEIL